MEYGTVRGGIYLSGGTITGSQWNAIVGTTWTPDTPWTVVSNSAIQSYNRSSADIRSPLYRTATLTISHIRRDSTDNATIKSKRHKQYVQVDEGKTTLYLGQSGALPSASPPATLIIEQQAGDGVKGHVTVGAYKANGSGGTVTDIPNVNIKVKQLIIGG